MPHKKKKAFHRNAERNAKDFYEKPLAVGSNQRKPVDDDTPKSFLRLIKRKSRKELIAEGTVKTSKDKNPKIQAGESLGEFRRRVDREIPLRLGGMNRETRPKKQKQKPKPIADDNDDDIPKKKKKKRGGKRSVSPDPYAHLARNVPFNDPVKAPPSLPAPSRTVKSSLPNSLSAARKNILESEREDVIARYRQRMDRT